MIIGIDASRANRGHKTGTEWYSYYLIKNLALMDSENQYILYTDKPLSADLSDLREVNKNFEHQESPEFDEKGFQIVKSPHNNFKAKVLNWPFRYFWTLGRFSLEMIFGEKIDILFVPAHGLPFFCPPKTINTIHDLAFLREKNLYEKQELPLERKIWRFFLNIIARIFTFGKYDANFRDYMSWSTEWALKKSAKIITVSESGKNDIKEFYGSEFVEKIEVIHNGFDNNLYKIIKDEKAIEEVLDSYGLTKPFFLYAGRLEKKKNTPFLVEAFAHFKANTKRKEKLVLLGMAGYGYDQINYIAKQYGLEDDLIIPGWVKNKDMPYIFNSAEAFVFPSRFEGFGIPVLEAMACGTPVLCSDIDVLRETAGEAALFFDLRDLGDLTAKMEEILKKDIREGLAKAGIERASKFSWKKSSVETLSLFQRI